MYYRIAVILLLASPGFGQLHRGNSGSMVSGLHNHNAIPHEGGVVYAWDLLLNPGASSDCITYHPPNIALFTGGLASSDLQCGGSPNPTLISTGLNFSANGGSGTLLNEPAFPNGFTLVSVAKPTAVNSAAICGMVNHNYPTDDTYQYQGNRVDLSASGDFGFLFDKSGTVQAFTTAGSTVTAGTWITMVAAYTSNSATSAQLWKNNAKIAGSWTIGTGATTLPAVQAESNIGSTHGGVSCVGTIGFAMGFDHRISDSAAGFIYRAGVRAMQFRGVSLPQ